MEIEYPLLQVAQQGEEIILEHCTLQNSNCGSDSYGAILYASSETEIKSNIGTSIVLSSALSANFTDCTFEDNTDNDICVISCHNLYLTGSMELPSLYFSNDYTNATLTIQVAENLQENICFDAFNYENVSIFEEGITLPDNVFSLKNEEYILGTNGTISKL